MAEWHCFKCKVKTEDTDVTLTYMDQELPGAAAIKCPTCGVKYLLEDFVVGTVNEGEKMIESK
jgi:DNA-directed RNA polymerase subunit RPC12/RpoP